MQPTPKSGYATRSKTGPALKNNMQQWMKSYKELKQFFEKHGHCNVPQNWPPNKSLGTWVNRQREWRRRHTKNNENGDLINVDSDHQERIDLLNQIGFEWNPKNNVSNNDRWNLRYKELKEFVKHHGHCNVPSRWPANKPLGQWVKMQRVWYRTQTNEHGQLITFNSTYQERIDLLNQIGFRWNTRATTAESQIKKSPSTSLADESTAMEDVPHDDTIQHATTMSSNVLHAAPSPATVNAETTSATAELQNITQPEHSIITRNETAPVPVSPTEVAATQTPTDLQETANMQPTAAAVATAITRDITTPALVAANSAVEYLQLQQKQLNIIDNVIASLQEGDNDAKQHLKAKRQKILMNIAFTPN